MNDTVPTIRRSRFSPPSLRVLITAIVVVPIALVAAALVVISSLTSRAIAEQLGSEIVAGAAARVGGEIRSYLSHAVRVSDLYTRRIQSGELPTRAPFTRWERAMLDDLATTPTVAAITFGNEANEATYLMRGRDERLIIGRYESMLPPPDNCVESFMDLSGNVDPNPIRVYRYEPTQRPWYTRAMQTGEPVWTDIYFWFGEGGAASETGSGYTRVVRRPDDSLPGVIVVDVTLAALSSFLKKLPLTDHGFAFIVDENGLLVAASHGHVNSDDGKRLPLAQSTSPAAQAAATAMIEKRHSDAGHRRIKIDGSFARAEVSALHPFPGINWQLITVLPESSFLADAQSMRRKSIYLALGAVGGALLLGLSLSRRLSAPLQKLSAHIARVGGGDFGARLDLREARELKRVSEDVNKMAAGLKHRMELEQSLQVATHVQQSLLPAGMPNVPGLEIAGDSRYCDLTGGDYYDFVEVTSLPKGQAMIAIGDVTGHGIGAALLMATARAALRAAAPQSASIAEIMARVNHVLTEDTRHGLFMTLLIAVIDPQKRVVRWVSAGHDPIIVYDPASGTTFDLDGGDLLLGLMDDITFEEFSRDQIPSSAILFAGTDGIWEAPNESGEMYGKNRLRGVIRENAEAGAKAIAAALEVSMKDFVGAQRQNDDVTFVVMKLGNGSAAS